MANCITNELCANGLQCDIVGDCTNPMIGGFEEGGIIINKADIASIVRDQTNPHRITSITLKTGARGWKFYQSRRQPFAGTNTTVEVGDYRTTFTHTVAGYVPTEGTNTAQEVMTPLANGKFVVILEHRWVHLGGPCETEGSDRDNQFQVFGADNGLTLTSYSKNGYENEGMATFELQETGSPYSEVYYIGENAGCDDVAPLIVKAD